MERVVKNGKPLENVVISGVSGRFPNARTIADLSYKLYNKIDMIDDLQTRYDYVHPELPKRTGKFYDLEKFDSQFFGINDRVAHTMDPQARLLLEHSYEAILDAGICPQSLKGKNVGVYLGICFCDSHISLAYQKILKDGSGLLGCLRSVTAERISFALDLKGPAMTVDTACSSSLFALDCALQAIQRGECESALVAGCNVVLQPIHCLLFRKLGVVSLEGISRPLDEDHSGYVRSEAITVVYLQKAKDAKRAYAQLLYSKTNSDGYKEQGITYPSGQIQANLIQQMYKEINFDPLKVNFVEAHSTGTTAGDPEECSAIEHIFCKGRENPLLIGTIKSNMGHSEGCAGICSLAKVILAFENNLIPPNINLENARKDIPGLHNGKLKVVTEPTELEGQYISVNSFGFGGANCHALLKKNTKEKSEEVYKNTNRLVVWAGRTKEAVNSLFNDLEKKPLDTEFVALLQGSQTKSHPANIYRGFGVFSQEEGYNAICNEMDVKRFSGLKKPMVWIFDGANLEWSNVAQQLLGFPPFRKSMIKCDAVLKGKGIDLKNIIGSEASNNDLETLIVGIVAQIGVIDIFRSLKIEPDFYMGYSIGELACAYADGGLSLEQTILAAYCLGKSYDDVKSKSIMKIIVYANHLRIMAILPTKIELISHDSPKMCTIIGLRQEIEEFMEELELEGIKFKIINSSNPSHSTFVHKNAYKVNENIKEIIQHPKKRSSKWISTSAQQNTQNESKLEYCSSIYITNNFSSAILFEEAVSLVPKNSLCIEFSANGWMKQLVASSVKNGIHIELFKQINQECSLVKALGRIFVEGVDMTLENLYTPINYPVSRGTPMISPLLKWNHSEDWHVSRYSHQDKLMQLERKISISLNDQEFDYVKDHKIDGRVLYPATGYLFLAWETLAKIHGLFHFDINVQFENVKFLRATSFVNKVADVEFLIRIQLHSGYFEICEGDTVVVTGKISILEDYEIENDNTTNVSSKGLNLTSKDFYKELRLRGYHYSDQFRLVDEVTCDGALAKIKWNDNWVTFLDCLLQPLILSNDTRLLNIPTSLEKLEINVKEHLKLIQEKLQKNNSDVIFSSISSLKAKTTICGGVKLTDMRVGSISRRKPPGTLVLETYKFVPNHCSTLLELSDIIRICIQIALENVPSNKIKAVEVLATEHNSIMSTIQNVLVEMPSITSDLTILTSQNISLKDVNIEDTPLASQRNCSLVVASHVFGKSEFFVEVLECLVDKGFLLLREKMVTHETIENFQMIASFKNSEDYFILLQRQYAKNFDNETVISLSNHLKQFEWLESIQSSIKKRPILLVSQNQDASGILGLTNCIRKEPTGKSMICVFIRDKNAPKFDVKNPFYKNQLDLGLAINVYENGCWGTYRHLVLKHDIECKPSQEHCFVNTKTKADLSSLTWFKGFLDFTKSSKSIAKIQYAALNFKDVMLASGKIVDNNRGRLENDYNLGFEYSGVLENGKRVMGVCGGAALSSKVQIDEILTFDCPDTWTLAEAATIPAVFGTVYYAFFFKANIQPKESILIHAGSGGIGISAIQVAFEHGLEVFTTVGTDEKKKYLLDLYPNLKTENIGNSRDTSFEQMIMERTNGKGVDYVLNSLADEKLQASIRCLAEGGEFLEIGKFDLSNNSKIKMKHFQKNITFHSVSFDLAITMSELFHKQELADMIKRDLKLGKIKPLKTTIFPASEVEQAFRFLGSGKHIGKVLLEVRKNEKDKETLPISVQPRIYCYNSLSYIICGGLGGFGMELADFLILRGCRKLVLSSSTGNTKSYHLYRKRIWEFYGVKTIISTANITTKSGCDQLISEASEMGPVGGIFNLALVLRDCILENQTATTFTECMAPKAIATKYLDQVSRESCPRLQYFVVFSSVSCGRGNAGQSNYGMANSVMERIIEERHRDGLPSKAIQWGAVGEVGILAEKLEENIDVTIGGTLPQRISSCLEVLDNLISHPDPVVSSIVVAENQLAISVSRDIVETVLNIMNIKESQSIAWGKTLSELGMDSLMLVEIRQALEREFQLRLTPQNLRTITLIQLKNMSSRQNSEQITNEKSDSDDAPAGLMILLNDLGRGKHFGETIVRLESLENSENFKECVLIIPGVEGVASNTFDLFAKELNLPTFLLQLSVDSSAKTVSEIAEEVFQDVFKLMKNLETFKIIGYSFGGCVAIELVKKLENKQKTGQLILLDSSPAYLKNLLQKQISLNEKLPLHLIYALGVIDLILPNESIKNHEKLMSLATLDARIDFIVEETKDRTDYSPENFKKLLKVIYNRFQMLADCDLGQVPTLDAPIMLVRPNQASLIDVDENYELLNKTRNKFSLKFVEGTHITMLADKKLVDIVNSFLTNLNV